MKIGTYCIDEHLMAKYGKMRIYKLEVELKSKILGPNLTICQTSNQS